MPLPQVVATMSVGYDHLDLAALKERNIKVCLLKEEVVIGENCF